MQSSLGQVLVMSLAALLSTELFAIALIIITSFYAICSFPHLLISCHNAVLHDKSEKSSFPLCVVTEFDTHSHFMASKTTQLLFLSGRFSSLLVTIYSRRVIGQVYCFPLRKGISHYGIKS